MLDYPPTIEEEISSLRWEAKELRSRNRMFSILGGVGVTVLIAGIPQYFGWLSRTEALVAAAALLAVVAIEDGVYRLRMATISDRITDLMRRPHA